MCGSLEAVEGITSPCGRVLGKMGRTRGQAVTGETLILKTKV
jgi:phosphoribosylformylglycinamidine (FGAM) synthase-like amidotransferase family enzyme